MLNKALTDEKLKLNDKNKEITYFVKKKARGEPRAGHISSVD